MTPPDINVHDAKAVLEAAQETKTVDMADPKAVAEAVKDIANEVVKLTSEETPRTPGE